MKDVQLLIDQLASNAAKGMPSTPESRPKEQYNVSTLKLVILLFTRLGDLFGSKAANRGLIIYADEEKGIFSETLGLWCRKLNGLTVDDFKVGMDGLEQKAEEFYRDGAELWPPSYAEFRALCFPKVDRDSLAHRPLESLYDPVSGTYRLEDQTAKAKRYEEGVKQSQALLSMFDEDNDTGEI